MNFTIYGDDSKGLIKLDPRTKILIFIVSGIMTLNACNDFVVMVYSIAICTIFVLFGKYMTALKASLLLGAVLYLRSVLDNSAGASPVVLMVIYALSTIFMFGFPMIMSLILLVQTTRISHFLSAFQAMHIPVKVTAPLAVFFRFLPTVADEWNGIRKAMAFRGIHLSFAQVIRHPGKTVEYILVPLLFSSVNVMEELAAAAMARGMDIDIRRNSYEEVRLRLPDYIVIAVFTGLLVFALIFGELIKGGMLK